MYEQFFGMTGTPFAKDIKVSDMYQSSSFNELLKRFEYIKEYRGIMALSGDPGMGKTSAIRFFMDSLNNQSFFPVYLPLATVGVTDFYKQLNRTLNGEATHLKSRVFESIQQQITAYAIQKNIIPVIIFDEAHLLKEQNIRELQIISNFERDTLDPAIIILVGQNVLLDKLKKKILQSFYQRISLKYQMEPLTKKETKEYILHNLKLCKCENEVLTEPAFTAVQNLSMGNIRLIGSLVKAALIYCFGEKKDKITEEDLLTVSSEVL
jgi:type II secretory pathway predicted ATPase ExeA